MKRIVLSLFSLAALAASSACIPNTEFRGEAHFPGGAQGCFASCQSQNMEMSGFVMSGEFASSCVCRPRPAAPPAGQPPAAVGSISSSDTAAMDASDVAAVTGVVMQKRASDEAARQRREADDADRKKRDDASNAARIGQPNPPASPTPQH